MSNAFVVIRNGEIQPIVYNGAAIEYDKDIDEERRLVHPDGWVSLLPDDEVRSVNLETIPRAWPMLGFQWIIDDENNLTQDIAKTTAWAIIEQEKKDKKK